MSPYLEISLNNILGTVTMSAHSLRSSATSATITPEGIRVNQNKFKDGAPMPCGSKLNDTFIFTSHIDGTWPSKTKELCLYDLHPFADHPVGIPRGFDSKTKKYQMQGFFCSWSCAYAYLLRENHSKRFRDHLNIFECFLRTVMNVRMSDLKVPPPLPYLAQLASSRRTVSDAVNEWRSSNNRYADFRPVENLFIPVSQIFEDRASREKALLRQDRHAVRMETTRAKPLIQTREAQRLQVKIVREKKREREVKRNAIDELLGVKMLKREPTSLTLK